MENKLIIAIIVTSLVAGSLSFVGGVKYQQTKLPARRASLADRHGTGGVGETFGENFGPRGFTPIRGEIVTISEGSLSIKLPDGSGKIVLLEKTARINRVEEASVEDLSAGVQISVFGQENDDGSLTARDIQIEEVPLEEVPPVD